MITKQSYSDVLLKQQALLQRQADLYKPLRTIYSDPTGNLIHSYPDGHKASLQAIQDVSKRIIEHTYTSNNQIQDIVNSEFNERMQKYIDYLVSNKDDLNYIDEVSELVTDFPHLQPLFEDNEQ